MDQPCVIRDRQIPLLPLHLKGFVSALTNVIEMMRAALTGENCSTTRRMYHCQLPLVAE
jgi:LDH2 family malate/lactate/ureidoglycolate dehydrogenase